MNRENAIITFYRYRYETVNKIKWNKTGGNSWIENMQLLPRLIVTSLNYPDLC